LFADPQAGAADSRSAEEAEESGLEPRAERTAEVGPQEQMSNPLLNPESDDESESDYEFGGESQLNKGIFERTEVPTSEVNLAHDDEPPNTEELRFVKSEFSPSPTYEYSQTRDSGSVNSPTPELAFWCPLVPDFALSSANALVPDPDFALSSASAPVPDLAVSSAGAPSDFLAVSSGLVATSASNQPAGANESDQPADANNAPDQADTTLDSTDLDSMTNPPPKKVAPKVTIKKKTGTGFSLFGAFGRKKKSK
jgi:hypothetical protein